MCVLCICMYVMVMIWWWGINGFMHIHYIYVFIYCLMGVRSAELLVSFSGRFVVAGGLDHWAFIGPRRGEKETTVSWRIVWLWLLWWNDMFAVGPSWVLSWLAMPSVNLWLFGGPRILNRGSLVIFFFSFFIFPNYSNSASYMPHYYYYIMHELHKTAIWLLFFFQKLRINCKNCSWNMTL